MYVRVFLQQLEIIESFPTGIAVVREVSGMFTPARKKGNSIKRYKKIYSRREQIQLNFSCALFNVFSVITRFKLKKMCGLTCTGLPVELKRLKCKEAVSTLVTDKIFCSLLKINK